jgi:ABC-type glycerol-3-phosphate transport system substrate-binding protein
MKKFQIILLFIFGAMAVFGLILFGLFRGGTSTTEATITMWGSVPAGIVTSLISDVKYNQKININIDYTEKDESVFDQDLIEALASGKGPDAIILPSNLLVRYSDKIYPIPTATLSVSDFKTNFAQIGEIYLTASGTLALPISVDPLVMYWNRDIFNEARKSVPVYWSDLQDIAPSLTKKDSSQNIIRSAVSLGEFSNVTHAKDILTLLMMQAGSQLVVSDGTNYSSAFDRSLTGSNNPASDALAFYTDFANPTKTVYSWNRALNNDKLAFISGDLAIYFGYASEYQDIANKNPNLNFDVAFVPQRKDAKTAQVIGNLLGVAILNASTNKVAAYTHLSNLTSSAVASLWSDKTGQAPARRDLLLIPPTETYKDLAWKSALLAKTWFDPNNTATNEIYRNAIESVVTGRLSLNEAVSSLNDQIDLLLANK